MPVNYVPQTIRANVQIVTGARAYGIVYQNATFRPMVVILTTEHQIVNPAQLCQVRGEMGQNPAAMTVIGWSGGDAHGAAKHMYGLIILFLPPGFFYRMNSDVGAANTNVVDSWIEVNQ